MISITELNDDIFAIFNFSIHISCVPLLCAVVFLFYLGFFWLVFLFGFLFKNRFMFNSGTKSLGWTVTLFTACPKHYIYSI